MLLGQRFKHGDDSLAHVAMEVLELARHVGQGRKAIRVQILVLERKIYKEHNENNKLRNVGWIYISSTCLVKLLALINQPCDYFKPYT